MSPRFVALAVSIAFLASCAPVGEPSFEGTQMKDLFPFDGFRSWEFINTDVDLTYKLVATVQKDIEVDPETNENIYTVNYEKECVAADPDCIDGEMLWATKWSSSTTRGVRIHGTISDNRAEWTSYSPPITLASATMKVGETVTSSTDLGSWTSTLVAIEDCPVYLPVEWKDCAHIVIEDVGGDEISGRPLAGDYWAIAGRNVVAIDRYGDSGQWQLSSDECEGECNGIW